MPVSLFELFKIGIGPSSSHTVGPMIAARRFVTSLFERDAMDSTVSILAETFGSLALTGMGHATDKAILLGLSDQQPHLIEPDEAIEIVETIKTKKEIVLSKTKTIAFNPDKDLKFNRISRLPFHSNGMKYSPFDSDKNLLREEIYYSIGAVSSYLRMKQMPVFNQKPCRPG
jgi:L-serine dehydratase